MTAFSAILIAQTYAQPHQLEYLDRGVVAVKANESQIYVSWRLLVSDPETVGFNVYRSSGGEPAVRLNGSPLYATTDYMDSAADLAVDNTYFVRTVVDGVELAASRSFEIAANAPVQQYLSLPLQIPEGGTTPDGVNYSYSANDLSVGDLDGDGRYEIVVKWYPSNAKDNAQSGHTGNCLLDAYTLEGELLWRIDLGVNIRSGSHYTQFIVYDLDGDGIAELACRTAEGSKDASGAFVAAPENWFGEVPPIDHTADRRNSSGYILDGPEFLTVYDGRTGLELSSTLYEPQRVPGTFFPSPAETEAIWGDGYGNRIDRFLGTVAYLDGERPSLVMCRGYYTGRNGVPGRTVLAAYDWRDGALTKRWVFDTYNNPENDAYRGQGAHSLTVGDVDGDGRDEIVYGACAIDDDGTGLYSTGIGHGDALHLSDMDPDRPGLEVWMPHESPSSYGEYGSELHDAGTGEVIFGVSGEGSDVGRGAAADIDPRYRGYETWASRGGMHSIAGQSIETNGLPSMNFLVWWDADPLRELLDGTRIDKWNWDLGQRELMFTDTGIASNNGTKATPALSADIYGDWREEVIWRSTDSSELRIYSTVIPAVSRMTTLMHDRQYRIAISWQNVAYNQPPHPSFFVGHGMATPPKPDYYFASSNQAPFVSMVSPSEGAVFEEGEVASLVAEASDADGVVEQVDFFQNNSFLGMDLSDPYTALWDAASGGSYLLRAVATDDDGAQSISLPVTVTVGHTETHDEATASMGWTPLQSSLEGYRGDGYLAFSRPWHFIEFTNLDGGLLAGEKTLRIRYSAGRPGMNPCFLTVNGVRQMIQLPSTGSWTEWATFEVKVPLNSGAVNTVRLQARGGQTMVDELTVAGIVRNQDPELQLIAPADGMTFAEGVDIQIRVEAQDIGGEIASVEFFAGELSLGSVSEAPYQLVWNDVGEGLYALKATATDDLGATAESAEAVVLVNNPPSVSISFPSDGAYLPSGEVVTITAEADDGVGSIAAVDFFEGETLLGSDTEAPYAVDWSSEVEGPYSFFAVATDNRGASTQSQPVELIVNPAGYSVVYQAEDATLSGDSVAESSNDGFNGTGYVNSPTDGGSILFENVDGGSGSMAILRIRYVLGAAASRTGSLTVNGMTQSIEFPPTGSWTTYATMDLPFPFDAMESNTIEIRSTGEDLANIDEIAVLGLQSEADRTYHAENAYAENVSLETNNLGYNGTGFYNFPSADGILEFRDIDGGIGGTITMRVRYALGASGSRVGTLTINGVESPIDFPSTGGWTNYDTIELSVSLLAGPQNTIRIASIGNDLGNVDEIVLSGITPNDIPEVTLLTPTDLEQDPATLFLVGDSTVASYGSSSYPQRGWGQELQAFLFDGEFEVVNRARGGRSSRSYIEEGLWDNVKAELSPGDYLMVQFGHNDRDWSKEERYTPPEDYKVYLAQYVNEARALGVEPILVTPMVMNAWRNGAMRNVFTESGNDYAGSMKEVAAELGVPLVDLNAKSHAFFSALDYDTAGRFYFNTYVAGEYPNFPNGSGDGTHFQEMGALLMAKMIAEGLRELQADPVAGVLADALTAQYPISIKANDPSLGRVSLSTELPEGVQVTLKALAAEGQSFVSWKDGQNNPVTEENIHTFEMGPEAASFIAYFNDETPVGPPAPGVKLPAGVNATAGWKLGDLMTFTAEASDPDGEIVKVEYFARDTRIKIGEATEAPYTFDWIVEGGTYDVWAEAIDNHGARGESEPYSVSIDILNEVPTVAISRPSTGEVFVEGESLIIEALASDPDGSILRVDFYADGELLGSDSEAPYSMNWDNLEAGPRTVAVQAVDNFGEASSLVERAVGVLFSEGGSLIQEAEDGILSGNFVVIDDEAASGGKAVDAIGGSGQDWVEFRFNVEVAGFYHIRTLVRAIDGTHDSMFVTIDGDTATEHTWDTARSSAFIEDYVKNRRGEDPVEVLLEAGAHVVRFSYRENLQLDLVELKLDRERPANFAPEVAINQPTAGHVFAAGESIELSATAADADGEVARVEYYVNGSKIGEASVAPYSLIWDGAESGNHSLVAIATDDQGASATSEPVEISVLFASGGESSQEAEGAVAVGLITVVDDAGASGGQFMAFHDPEATGIQSGVAYQIVNLGSGHAVEANGRAVSQAVVDGSAAQKWILTENADGYYSVISVETGEALDEYRGGSTNVGTWTFGGASNQQWGFVEDGGAYIVSARSSSNVLSVEEPMDADGSNVYRTADGGSDYQRWALVAASSGSGPESNYLEFRFNVEEAETYNLSVTYRALDENRNSVYVSVDGGPADQYLWEMPLTSGFESALVTPVGQDETLELELAAGPHVVRLGYSEPVDIDQVELVLDPDIGNGRTYQFVNVGSGKALQSTSRAVTQGDNLFADSQQWVVEELSEGEYSIILKGTSEGLDHYINDGNIGTWTFNASKPNQRWRIVEVEAGKYTLSPVDSDASIVASVSSTADGANVAPAAYVADPLQQWLIVAPGVAEPKAHTIYTIGDSTVANYSAGYYPQTGWGQVLGGFFDPEVEVKNRAIGGTSSRSFYNNHWATVRDELKEGDFVLIGFGINDRAADEERNTTGEEFKEFLTLFAAETQAAGAIPVLVSTVRRNAWNGEWNGGDPTTLYDSYHEHPVMTRELAGELGLPLIDLDLEAGILMESLGPDYTGPFMYMNLGADEYPIGAKADDVHFQEMGAIEMARLVVEGIESLDTDPNVSALIEWIEPSYEVAVSSNDASMGIVTRTASYPEGTNVTVKALPADGYELVHWEDASGAVVSTDALMIFTMGAEPLSFHAVFGESAPVEPDAATGILPGETYTIANLGSGLQLQNASGREVTQGAESGAANQTFVLSKLEDGYWTVTSVANSENLDTYNGNQVGTYVASPTNPNQNWTIVLEGGAYRFESRSRVGSVLSVDGDSLDDGANVGWTADAGSDFQRWTLSIVE
nr:Ig-like domain-containing protein [Pelagicoccus enzymogenes]